MVTGMPFSQISFGSPWMSGRKNRAPRRRRLGSSAGSIGWGRRTKVGKVGGGAGEELGVVAGLSRPRPRRMPTTCPVNSGLALLMCAETPRSDSSRSTRSWRSCSSAPRARSCTTQRGTMPASTIMDFRPLQRPSMAWPSPSAALPLAERVRAVVPARALRHHHVAAALLLHLRAHLLQEEAAAEVDSGTHRSTSPVRHGARKPACVAAHGLQHTPGLCRRRNPCAWRALSRTPPSRRWRSRGSGP